MKNYILLALFILTFCTIAPTVKEVIEKNQFPKIDEGWLDQYSEHIKRTVGSFPNLLKIDYQEMKSFCPGWNTFNDIDKLEFYADLFYAIAKPESNYKRFSWYAEPMGNDSVTGYQVRSEGLLQLSYQDPKNYKAHDKRAYEFCPFNWDEDKEKFKVDIEMNKSGAGGERTIHDPYKNLQCGVFIVHLLTTKFRPIASSKWDFKSSTAGYWSVLRPERAGYKKFRPLFESFQPKCKL